MEPVKGLKLISSVEFVFGRCLMELTELHYHEEEPMIQHKTSYIKHSVMEQLTDVN